MPGAELFHGYSVELRISMVPGHRKQETNTISDQLLQPLSEGFGGQFAMDFDPEVLAQGFGQREGVELNIWITVRKTFQDGGNRSVSSAGQVRDELQLQ